MSTLQLILESPHGYWSWRWNLRRALSFLTLALLWIGNAQSQTVDSFNPKAVQLYGGANRAWVDSLAVQPDGKILIGGTFTNLGGMICSNIGRLNLDGSVDNRFNAQADYEVRCLTMQPDGRILVGGFFDYLNGQLRNNIGRLETNGALDLSFSLFPSDGVWSLVSLPEGKILLGGSFNSINNDTNYSLVGRLESTGMPDPGFASARQEVTEYGSMALQPDNRILVGGYRMFDPSVWRLSANGTLDTNYNTASTKERVWAVAVQADGKLVVAGDYYFNRFNPDGTQDTNWHLTVNGTAYALALQADGNILVGGSWGLGRVTAAGQVDTNFTKTTNGTVSSLAIQWDGNILVGGNFTQLGGQARTNIGRLNNTGPATSALSYAGGKITWLRGGPRRRCGGPPSSTVPMQVSLGACWAQALVLRAAGNWQESVGSAPEYALEVTWPADVEMARVELLNPSWGLQPSFLPSLLAEPIMRRLPRISV